MCWEVRTTGSDTGNGGGFRGGALIAAPTSAPTVFTNSSGGTVAAGTYYAVITYLDGYGETSHSPEAVVGPLTGTTSFFQVQAPPLATNIVGWALYVGTASGGPYREVYSGIVPGSNYSVTTTPPTTGTQAPGTDYSQQASPQLSINNTTVKCTTPAANSNTLTFTLGYTPTSADVGNTVRITGGTNINAGTYEIIAFTSTTWTLSGSANLTTAGGAGSAVLGGMGGALATPGRAMNVGVAGNTVYVQSGTYLMTNTSNVAGGRLIPPQNTTIWGYGSVRGDEGTKPIFAPTAANEQIVSFPNNHSIIRNVEFQSNGQTGSLGCTVGTGVGTAIRRCKFNGVSVAINFSATTNAVTVYDCEFTGVTSAITNTAAGQFVMWNCSIIGGTASVNIQSIGSNATCIQNCIFSGVGAAGISFTAGTSDNVTIRACTFDACQNGIDLSSSGSSNVVVENCLFTNAGSGGYGIKGAVGGWDLNFARNCAGYNNSMGGGGDVIYITQEGWVTLTANPYNNAAGLDFSLNNVAGGGAACRAAGLPTGWPDLSTPNHRDVGAAQSSTATAASANQQQTGTSTHGGFW
jgi:hypothetical protein